MSPLFDKAAAMLKLSPEAVETWRERLRPRAPDGLSARLLLLTVAFTLAVEALIMGPNLAAFHERWLRDRLQAAELASVGVEALPYSAVEDDTAAELMRIGGVQAVALTEQGVRRLLLQAPNLPRAPELIDLRQQNSWARLTDPWRTLFGHPDRSLRVQAKPRYRSGDFIEIVTPAQPLKLELKSFLLNSLLVSLLVSVTAGALLYGGLALLVLRPLRRVTRSMERFAADPESEAEPPSDRHDEIGRVERELSRMQEEVRQSLRSRARLVALGEAVAKINHDLRNMLTSAQIASERLAASRDPKVAQALPRLERALDRAVKLATDVLVYGKTQEAAPDISAMPFAPALEMAAEEARLSDDSVRLETLIDPADQVIADPDQLHRIVANLLRNAREAIEAQEGRTAPGVVTVSLSQAEGATLIRFSDNGPGVSKRAQEKIFQPFAGSSRPGGAGLGLAIARELAQGHGGDLTLAETGEQGSVFELRLPGAPPQLKTKRARAKGA